MAAVDRSGAMAPRRGLRGLLAVRLLGGLADGAMLPFVVLWAHRDGGLSGSLAGALFLAQAAGELIGGLAGGSLADRLGHRRTLAVSTFGMMLGYGSLAVIHHAALAVPAFLLAGLFEAAFHPTIAALIGDLTPDDELHRAFGLNRVAANLGRIAGPLLGAAAVAVSLSGVFAAAGALLAAALAAVLVAVPSDRAIGPESAEVGTDGSRAALTTIVRDHRLALLILGGGLLSITVTWWEADGLVLLRRQYPLSPTGYAALFAIAAAATVLLQVPTSRWAARHTTRTLLLAGAVAQGVGLAGLAAAGLGYPVMIAAVLVVALGQMLYSPAVSTFTTRHAPPGRRATYQAAVSTTEDIGTALGPTTGLALGTAGPAALSWLLALPLALAASLAAARATGPDAKKPPGVPGASAAVAGVGFEPT